MAHKPNVHLKVFRLRRISSANVVQISGSVNRMFCSIFVALKTRKLIAMTKLLVLCKYWQLRGHEDCTGLFLSLCKLYEKKTITLLVFREIVGIFAMLLANVLSTTVIL